MNSAIHRYDFLLPGLESSNLKKMVVLWGGRAKLGKDDCVRWLREALTAPAQIDAAIGRMKPYERAALGLMKLFGGRQDLLALSEAVRATGALMQEEPQGRYGAEGATRRALIERGIVLPESGYRYYDYSYSSVPIFVITDDRILARIEPLEHTPLKITAAQLPAAPALPSIARSTQSLVLDVIAMLRAVNDIGGIGLTKAGIPRVTDARKFGRKMGWDKQAEFDGLAFPEPARAYVGALMTGGLLTVEGDRLVSAIGLDQVGGVPASELVSRLAGGIPGLSEWYERDPGRHEYWFNQYAGKWRFAVLAALCCLPASLAWYRFDDFERALFARVGAHLSIDMIPVRPYTSSKADAKSEQEVWQRTLREHWEQHDVPWLQAAFRSWLYAFGLVEVVLTRDAVEYFRLTAVGRIVFGYERETQATAAPAEQTPAWIVQPNFDVVVYLDSASTAQVAFLEQVTERVNLAQHMAQYRLTRESVYAGLQRGMDTDRLLACLAAGSRLPLPGNVVAEVRNWAGLRERLVVRRQAELLEFADAAARQAALERGLTGTAVAERFLLLTERLDQPGDAGVTPEIIDYAHTPAFPCLKVSEEGLITLVAARRDLFTPGYLDLWARRIDATTWQLTREQVAETIRRGRTLRELLALLQDRLTHPLPGILRVALQAWSGETVAAGMIETVVLQCKESETLNALLASKLLKPHLLGRIGSDVVLVKSGSAERVREILAWAGVQVTAKVS